MADQIPGKGTFLEVDVTGGSTFVAVPLVIKLNIPNPELKVKEITHLLSTFIENRGTIADPGKLTFTAWFDLKNAVHTSLRDLPKTPHNAKWRITFPTTPPIVGTFSGILTSVPGEGVEVENFLMIDGCSIQLTSFVAWT
jgi:hypothetical protein